MYDPDDFGTVNPRKTDNPQNKGTDRLGAYSAQVHKGLYDYEYSEMEDGVKVTYIVNIYRGDTKKITTDYGDVTLNKVIKYFYDENGNNTAIVEENQNDINHTICITYTYDSDGNVTYICDQKTEYTMSYKNGDMKTLKVGDVELVNYESNITENSNILEQITLYGNGQKIRTVTTKSIDENGNSYTKKSEIYYCDDTQCSYVTEYDNEGRILKFIDCTGKEKISYDYVYSDDNITVARNDGFMKEVKNSQNVDGNITDKNISYTFEKNQGSKVTYQESQKTDMSDEDKTVTTDTLYNGDNIVVTSSDENKKISYEIYSQLCKKDILNSYQDEMSDTKISYNINAYGENKKYEYIYDLSGNITEIKLDGNRIYEYAYDVHGRLVKELDYVNSTGCVYGYTSTGNVVAKHLKKINSDGSLTNIQDIKYSYENGDWADQLTKYGNQKITYDSVGNPVKYHDGKKFEWIRGRELSKIILSDDSDVTYEYNQNGLRTHKETNITSTDYEWDEKKLIRETVTYKLSGRKYDIWYYYDGNGDIAGFEYNEISEMNQELNRKSIYYEKNMQGDVIGLIDSTGAKIASYAYDAWGNVVDTVCYEKNEIPYALNHITYRGYYFDNESGFYYLQSRYYDAEVGRFINADDVKYIGANENRWSYNLYMYCEGNPIIGNDETGNLITYPIKVTKTFKRHVWQAANVFLTAKGYLVAKMMFHHALYGGGKKMPSNKLQKLTNKIKSDIQLSRAVKKELDKCKKRIDGQKVFNFAFEFTENRDLYYSVQHIRVFVNARMYDGHKWNLVISIGDIYDFTETRSWFSFAGLANNIGKYMQDSGQLKPFRWGLNYKTTF